MPGVLRLIFSLLLAVLPLSSVAENGRLHLAGENQVEHAIGKWKFQPSDKPEYSRADFADAEWPQIPVQNEWRMHGFDYAGNAWYRLHFTIGQPLHGSDLALILSPIASASEVYCNGKLIGSKGSVDAAGNILRPSEQLSLYFIPSGLLRPKGDNTLAIRVVGYNGVGGMFGNDWVYLGRADRVHERFMILVIIPGFMAAAFLIMALYHFILLYARKSKEYAYFAMLCVAIAGSLLGMNGIGYWLADSFHVNQMLIHLIVGFFPIAMAGYIREYFDIQKSRVLLALSIAGYLLLTAVSLHLVIKPLVAIYIKYILPVGMLFIMFSLLAFIGYTIRGIRAKIPGAKLLAAGFAVLSFGLANDMLQYLSLPVSVKFADIGFLTVVVCMASAMAIKIQRVYVEKEHAQAILVETMRNADKLKDDFLANTSHELRTPLFGIIGLSESLLNEPALSARAQENIGLILASSNRLARLVDDILDMSKLKNRDIILAKRPVSLYQAVDIVFKIIQPMVGKKEIVLQNLVPRNLTPVWADENRLQQILHNLIGNAIKFTKRGYVRVDAKAQGRSAFISVIDSGIGIETTKLETIFNAFEQAEASIERQYGGTGLGLTITKRLVELHGGLMSVTSEPGHGAMFSFSLPLADADLTADSANEPLPGALREHSELSINEAAGLLKRDYLPTDGLQVLIADDEPVNIRLLTQVLEEIGIQPRTASDGESALELMQSQEKWDLILLDVMMPGMNGFRVCERIRERWSATELPVIFLTARGSSTDLVKGFSLGANDYLPKPVAREEIIARIQTQLSLVKARLELMQLNDIRKELELAQRIQRASLPESLPQSPYWKVAVDFEPMALIGGDFYSFLHIDARHLGVFVADVSGHGIPAALIASMLSISINLQRQVADHPDQVLESINGIVHRQLEGNFVTSCYAYIDLEQGIVSTASAGHLPLILLHRQSGVIERLKPSGKVHGIFPEVTYQIAKTNIGRGDRVVLYSDGVTEAGSSGPELYGQERFEAFIQNNVELVAADLCKALRENITAFTGTPVNYEDDFTLIVVDVV
jgi:two-component system sensor histidine kinase ChiS